MLLRWFGLLKVFGCRLFIGLIDQGRSMVKLPRRCEACVRAALLTPPHGLSGRDATARNSHSLKIRPIRKRPCLIRIYFQQLVTRRSQCLRRLVRAPNPARMATRHARHTRASRGDLTTRTVATYELAPFPSPHTTIQTTLERPSTAG